MDVAGNFPPSASRGVQALGLVETGEPLRSCMNVCIALFWKNF